MSGIRVQLQQFEGPLDLLLYLIRKEEMDIFNINVTAITQQYLDYIKLMKEFDLEVAGEFIAMASTLIHIKSKMLLPQYDENGEILDQEDPRKELVQKLLEYEKFKEAAKALYERPLLNRDLWARGIRERIEVKDDEIELEENALFSLIGSYRRAMKTLYKRVHKVNIKLQSIASRILEMRELLNLGRQVVMRELFNPNITDFKERSRNALITFLSLLELGKMGFVSIYQTENYGDIYVTGKKTIEGDVVSRVEEYDSINSDQIAEQLMMKSKILSEEELAQIENEADQASLSAEVLPQMSFDEIPQESLSDDMASDDEILAAELELEQSGDTEQPLELNSAAVEASIDGYGDGDKESSFVDMLTDALVESSANTSIENASAPQYTSFEDFKIENADPMSEGTETELQVENEPTTADRPHVEFAFEGTTAEIVTEPEVSRLEDLKDQLASESFEAETLSESIEETASTEQTEKSNIESDEQV